MPTHSPEHRAGITLDETGQVIDETAELLMRIKRFKKEQVKRREQLARDKIIVQAMMMAIGGATDEEITQQFPYLPIPIEELRARVNHFNAEMVRILGANTEAGTELPQIEAKD